MSPRIGHDQDQFRIILLPYQKPVAFGMALP